MAKMGVYSKTDFLVAYGVTMYIFEKMIDPIKQEIGWEKGRKQKFSPKLVRVVFDHLGEP